MKWKSRLFLQDRVGETRSVEKFLWLPRLQDGHWHWLETVTAHQQILRCDVGGSGEWGKYGYYWVTQKIEPKSCKPDALEGSCKCNGGLAMSH
jgi:hypothetical protein